MEAEKVQNMLKFKEIDFEKAREGEVNKKKDERNKKAIKDIEKLQRKQDLELHKCEKEEAFVLKSFKEDHE